MGGVGGVDVPAEAAQEWADRAAMLGDVNAVTVRGAKILAAAVEHHLRVSARSLAVVKTPACPATPPMYRAVGSCTTPRKGAPVAASISVGAMRAARDAAGEGGLLHPERGRRLLRGAILVERLAA